jgi:UDP-GlcNAc3NAcA epimerase
MRLLSIVGARPQFMKVAVIAAALKASPVSTGIEHRILHTGQHYDPRMSDCFFRQLNIPEPDFHLGVGSGTHGEQTGAMLVGIERALNMWRPDAVIVYGDTNSTVAGALAASKMHVRVIHLEAGLRSFNRRMPEEINRVATDHLSDVLLCPTATAMQNAQREGLGTKSWLTGDVMLDLLLQFAARLVPHVLATGNYALVTMHRAENTDDPERMSRFITLLERLPLTAILPMHPRLRAKLQADDLTRIAKLKHVHLLEPCDYREMLALERDARVILTDSGGVQKEAYFLGVPCLTLRAETEWEETLAGGWNRVVGMEPDLVLPVIDSLVRGNGFAPKGTPDLNQFGSGRGGEASVQAILNSIRAEA